VAPSRTGIYEFAGPVFALRHIRYQIVLCSVHRYIPIRCRAMRQFPYDAQRRENLPTQKESRYLIDCSDFLKLTKYSELPDCSASYAVIEALRHLFRQNKGFEAWLSGSRPNKQKSTANFEKRFRATGNQVKAIHCSFQFGMFENPASSRQHSSLSKPCSVALKQHFKHLPGSSAQVPNSDNTHVLLCGEIL
jgi:hypothetical protein